MSGGSYYYAFDAVERFAEALENRRTLDGGRETTFDMVGVDEARQRFAAHLHKVAAAMRAIEWVESCDSDSPDDVDAIEAVIGKQPTGYIVDE